jgi:hypothetical protein
MNSQSDGKNLKFGMTDSFKEQDNLKKSENIKNKSRASERNVYYGENLKSKSNGCEIQCIIHITIGQQNQPVVNMTHIRNRTYQNLLGITLANVFVCNEQAHFVHL